MKNPSLGMLLAPPYTEIVILDDNSEHFAHVHILDRQIFLNLKVRIEYARFLKNFKEHIFNGTRLAMARTK